MPQPVKFSSSNVPNSIKKGNVAIGVNSVDYGPTSITDWWAGIDPPVSGYTVYAQKASNGPSIMVAQNDTDLIGIARSFGASSSVTTTAGALNYFASQSDMIVVNKNYSDIVTSGLVLNLDASFVASYPVSGTSWYDISGSGNTGTLVNGPTFDDVTGSIVFDGLDDESGISCNFQNLTGITINVLYYSNTNNSTALTRVSNSSFILHFRGAGFYLIDSAGTVSGYLGWNPQPTGFNWRMLTATWDGTTMKLYQNGVKQTNERSFTGTGTLRSIPYINLGYYFNTNQPWTNGKVVNYQLYNRALSTTEISQNYYGAPIVTSGLTLAFDPSNIVSYPTSGTSLYDLTANANNGTLVSGPTFSSGYGGTIVLDGTNDYISTNYGKDINPFNTPLTVSVFIKPNLVSTNQMYISTGQSRGNGDSNQRMYVAIYNGNWDWGIRGSSWSSGNVAASLTWSNITVVIDSTSARFYLNGEQIYTKSVNNTFVLNDNFWFGTHDNSYYFNGSIGLIKIYNRALSVTEIIQNFNAHRNRFGL